MNEQEKDLDCGCSCGDCGCDCDHDHDHDDMPTVTLTLDDDTVVECAVLTIYPCAGKQYIALLPLDENGENEDGEVFLSRVREVDGNPTLENIEDDDEYEAAADAFDEFLDSQEYDELVDAEDEE